MREAEAKQEGGYIVHIADQIGIAAGVIQMHRHQAQTPDEQHQQRYKQQAPALAQPVDHRRGRSFPFRVQDQRERKQPGIGPEIAEEPQMLPIGEELPGDARKGEFLMGEELRKRLMMARHLHPDPSLRRYEDKRTEDKRDQQSSAAFFEEGAN